MKTLYIIRHGQAEHNVASDRTSKHNIRDPKLTQLGQEQSKAIKLPKTPEIILISPLTRAIQTALYAFPDRESSFELDINIQERAAGSKPCDTGREASELAKEFENLDKNLFAQLPAEWYHPKMTAEERAEHFKSCIRKRTETVIAIVAHDGIFQIMFKKVLKNGEVCEIEFE